jgi:hypothetical protein
MFTVKIKINRSGTAKYVGTLGSMKVALETSHSGISLLNVVSLSYIRFILVTEERPVVAVPLPTTDASVEKPSSDKGVLANSPKG